MNTHTTDVSRRARLRKQDADRIAASFDTARKAMETASVTWGLWADDVRACTEARLGRSYEPHDPAVLGDPEYSAALDVRGLIGEVIARLEDAAGKFAEVEKSAAARGGGQP
jgi:hypothetical protein